MLFIGEELPINNYNKKEAQDTTQLKSIHSKKIFKHKSWISFAKTSSQRKPCYIMSKQ